MPASRHLTLSLLLIGLVPFFFIGGPSEYGPRSYEMLWNLGHILFFIGLTVVLLNRKSVPGNFSIQCIAAIILSIIVGAAIELLQRTTSRSADIRDLLLNIVGVMVALFFILPSRTSLPRRLRFAFQMLTIAAVGSQILPALAAITDETIARKQFPVLSNLETPLEIGRWKGDSIAIDKETKQTGNGSLRAVLGPNQAVGAKFLYFPRDWQEYDYFQFSIHNPSANTLPVACRIKDRKKTPGQPEDADSFNRQIEIPPGWNTVIIRLSDLKASRSQRELDLSRIYGVRFFSTGPSRPITIHIDDLRLGRDPNLKKRAPGGRK